MEIQKNFELRAVGDKVVLRQCLPPTYEMKVILVADKYENRIIGLDAFVLSKDEQKHIFREADNDLYHISADAYMPYFNKILFQRNGKWYIWEDIKDETKSVLLGELLPQTTFYFLNREENKVYLNWLTYDGDTLKVNTKIFKSFEVLRQDVLDGQLSFNDNVCPDVFKGETEEGTVYISIKEHQYIGFSGFERCMKTDYRLIFSDKSSAKLLELNEWVRSFLNEQRKVGLGVPAKVNVTEKHLSGEEDLTVTLSVYHQAFRNVDITLNLSMLRKGEKKAYFVTSSEKSAIYSSAGTDVKLVDNKDSITLYIIKKQRADALFVSKKEAFSFSALKLKKNVKIPD